MPEKYLIAKAAFIAVCMVLRMLGITGNNERDDGDSGGWFGLFDGDGDDGD